MKNLLPPHDPIEAMGETYELLLERILQSAHREGANLHIAVDVLQHDSAVLNKFGKDALVRLEAYVKRDLLNAAWYLSETGKALEAWIGFDSALIKPRFWQMFSAAADKTTTELLQIKLQAEIAEYHTGEMIGLGTLVCDQCGEKLHFHQPGHIPPCPKCKNTHFHRQNIE